MGQSQTLFQLQQLDTALDSAQKRIQEINLILKDRSELSAAESIHHEKESTYAEKSSSLKSAEHAVSLQNSKLELNQKKLYSGVVTNPKELEDLQLESQSLTKYLEVLEERQLEAMLAFDQSKAELDSASKKMAQLTLEQEKLHKSLNEEISRLKAEISDLKEKKDHFLETENLPDISSYQSLRKSSGGIAVALMKDSSCLSCGASIPSAIEQEAKSPAKLAYCPTCKRILHPE
jgi:predicted  nucleic acid-binding Zn-ribbon protein